MRMRPIASLLLISGLWAPFVVVACSASGSSDAVPLAGVGGTGASGTGGVGGLGGHSGTAGFAGAPPVAGDFPATIAVPSTTGVVVGPPSTVPPAAVSVAAYEISQTPITVAQYRACVTAGACSPPGPRDPKNYFHSWYCLQQSGLPEQWTALKYNTWFEHDDNLPMTCLDPSQMATYCAWLGQRLPNEAEWYLGARGPLPHIYSWGDAMPTCDQFPDAYAYVPKGDAVNCGGPPIYFAPFEVGKHPAGASPLGLLDVCVTYEVFSSAPGQALCGAPFCSVGPKAMETVSGLSADGIYDGPGVAPKWITSFRCASSTK